MNRTAKRISKRPKRAQDLISAISDNLEKNLTGLEFFKGVLDENSDRLYIDDRGDNLVIRGTLAWYKVPLSDLLCSFSNPFLSEGIGFPEVEIHPLHKWLRRNYGEACIQPTQFHSEIPGTDSIGILALSLLNDSQLFCEKSQESFRRECISLYGFGPSPILDLLIRYIADIGGELNPIKGEILVNGTDGFRWIIGGLNDPDVRSFSISSYVRSGPIRLHTIDTFHSMSACKDLDYQISILARSPKVFITGDDYDLTRSSEIVESVAEVHAPLQRAIDDGSAYCARWID